MEESAKENQKLNSTPLPHTCFSVKSLTPPGVLNKKQGSYIILLINYSTYSHINHMNHLDARSSNIFNLQVIREHTPKNIHHVTVYNINILAWEKVPATSNPSKSREDGLDPR